MMLIRNLVLVCIFCLAQPAIAEESPQETAEKPNPLVLMQTSLGDIQIELFPEHAPITVENFLAYIDEGYYNNLIFHRVIYGFVVQGGGFTKDLIRMPPRGGIKNESIGGLKNLRGTIAMARREDPDSANSQFYFNLKHNKKLNAKKKEAGYTVFGIVVEGMEVVEEISKVETQDTRFYRDVPIKPIFIKAVKLIEPSATASP